MSMSDLFPSGPGTPAAVPLRHLVLGALAEAVITRRTTIAYCASCGPARPCPGHAQDAAAAGQYEAAYMRVRGIGSDGAMLALTGGLAP